VRPSRIEVVNYNEAVHCNVVYWRVRIWLNEDETISTIEQEVEVGCYEDIMNGHHLSCELKHKKYNDETNVVVVDARALKGIIV
jgi:hypothetical protein